MSDGHSTRWRIVVAVLILGWLTVAGITGPFAGKLADVQENDNAAWLPRTAESTRVETLNKDFVRTTSFPLIVVFTGPEGAVLSAAQTSAVAAFGQQLPSAALKQGGTVGDWLDGAPPPPIPSADGKALLLQVSLTEKAATERLPDGLTPVQAVTDLVRDTGQVSGTQANATGPAGFLADFFEIFGEIDSTLLLTALGVVALILIVVYRSPFVWALPLLAAVVSVGLASAVIYAMARADLLTVNGQSQSILFILVIGAGTDYALLLIARYREELHLHERRIDAMLTAWRNVVAPIVASGATVSLGLLCLLFSDLASNKSLGPVAAVGIASTVVVMLTFLPAVLVAFPRWVFWPRIPRHDEIDPVTTGFWSRVARLVGQHPVRVAGITTVGLLALAALSPSLKADGLGSVDAFTKEADSVVGQKRLAEHYPGGTSTPAVIIGKADQLPLLLAAATGAQGVVSAAPYTGAVPGAGGATEPMVVDGLVRIDATIEAIPDSPEAYRTIDGLRAAVHAVPGAQALVGGSTAINADVQSASRRDRNVIIPIVLVVIFLVLALLLRALFAPALLIATVVLSFLATMGVCYLAFGWFGFAGADNAFPLFAFVFLVALGIDYNIFLMTRVREESVKLGTRAGVLKGLTATGGVITSAGIVLAATFTVLGILPLVFIAELGFAVAFGVLLDTTIVRSLLVPALSHWIGPRIWWPSALGKPEDERVAVEA